MDWWDLGDRYLVRKGQVGIAIIKFRVDQTATWGRPECEASDEPTITKNKEDFSGWCAELCSSVLRKVLTTGALIAARMWRMS
jgi:hypothetical protein